VEGKIVELGGGAAQQIIKFLDAHPRQELTVAVGYASVAGIAWLAKRTQDRPVTLLIGDVRQKHFEEATDRDRSDALDFIQRGDTEILNWYRTERNPLGKAEAHLKVWAIASPGQRPSAYLIGSANLTKTGLHKNVEVMAIADHSDHGYLLNTLNALTAHAWDAKSKLRDYLQPAPAPARPASASPIPAETTPAPRLKPEPRSSPRRVPQRSSPRAWAFRASVWAFGVIALISASILLIWLAVERLIGG